LAAADDSAVWRYAAAHGLILVSKDSDFRHLATVYGPPPKVIWLQVGNGPTSVVASLMRGRIADVQAFLADQALALFVLP
jgi:predicted nuclease of predicted toxin-antitoxin system